MVNHPYIVNSLYIVAILEDLGHSPLLEPVPPKISALLLSPSKRK